MLNIALIGNPNVGKSVIFNLLTGIYADVSNYPGTTIEITKAPYKENPQITIIDTPGVYGISDFNDEENVTKKYFLQADLIINISSATSLKRDLFLTKQLLDLGKPMLLVVNQVDDAALRKVNIDFNLLAEKLGINVIPTIAVKNIGVDKLKDLINNFQDIQSFRVGELDSDLEPYVNPYVERVLSRAEALLIAEGDQVCAEQNNIKLPNNYLEIREKLYLYRREQVNELYKRVVEKNSFSKRAWLGKFLLHPIGGSVVAVLILYFFLYQFLGVFVAGTVVDWMENGLFKQYYEPLVVRVVGTVFTITPNNLNNLLISDPMNAVGTFLAGDYGVLTLTITYLYGLLLPLVAGFYFGLAILEDTGYLPRLAVLADGVLTKLGMNGRAIIPLILGGGCVTMAVVTTRLLKSKKEKLITMALLGLSIPCSAQLGVIQGLLSNVGGVIPWLIWGFSLVLVFSVAGTILNKVIPGTCGDFVSDIPPLRMPKLNNVVKKTYTRSKIFLDEATPAFFIAAAVVAFMQVSGVLNNVIEFFEPLIENVLLLPKEVTLSFILGMVRRDFGAFGLLELPLSHAQIITSCIVLTLFVPCIATIAVMIKEGSLKSALLIWLSSWVLAFGFGAIIARVLAVVL